MAVAGVHQCKDQFSASSSGLLNQLIKDLANHLGTLLWNSLLVVLIVDKRHTEAGLVALGPFEVAVIKPISRKFLP